MSTGTKGKTGHRASHPAPVAYPMPGADPIGVSDIPLSKLRTAPWNYKEADSALAQRLAAGIQRHQQQGRGTGQLETMVVRSIEGGLYEVVDGNHRLELLGILKRKTASVINVGNIPLIEAKRIGAELNEVGWKARHDKLAVIFAGLVKTYGRREIIATAPFAPGLVDDFVLLAQHSWADSESKYKKLSKDGNTSLRYTMPMNEAQAACSVIRATLGKAGIECIVVGRQVVAWTPPKQKGAK